MPRQNNKTTSNNPQTNTNTPLKDRKIAIACQGGGSHTAFTAGVLMKLIEQMGTLKYRIVTLTGTSGGALCAYIAANALSSKGADRAIANLQACWEDDLAANDPFDAWLNLSVVNTSMFAPGFRLNPNWIPSWAADALKTVLEKYDETEPKIKLFISESPALLVGAVDVINGSFKVFKSHVPPEKGPKEKEQEGISYDSILASAAVPDLFRAVAIEQHWYWDGLLSQNPPIRDIPDVFGAGRVQDCPDDIWIIQVNPTRCERPPKSLEEIRDRQNELAGNLSLRQEAFFIQKMNELTEAGSTVLSYQKVDQEKKPKKKKVKYIRLIKPIEMAKEVANDLNYASKLDRSSTFINMLIKHGQVQATAFLNTMQQTPEIWDVK